MKQSAGLPAEPVRELYMPRFFISPSDISEQDGKRFVTIRGEDAGHITRVLRMRPGEAVTVCDTDGREYETVIRSCGTEVLCEVTADRLSRNEPPYEAVVYQALVKGDRFDTVLQKATELGASRIVPVVTARCTVKIDRKEVSHKLERWRRIVLEASKQCGRGRIPTVGDVMTVQEAILEARGADLPLFCYEGGGTRPLSAELEACSSPASAAILIGPEGGWSEEEVALCELHGIRPIGLGNRILRTETAAPFVLACLSCRYEIG